MKELKKNKVKPTPKQRKAFENIKRGMKLRDAMLEAGYTASTSTRPKRNLTDSPGFEVLIKEYREDLKSAGVCKEVLAEVQAEGLFDQDARVRLEYLRENKKDLGLVKEQPTILQQFNVGGEMSLEFIGPDEK